MRKYKKFSSKIFNFIIENSLMESLYTLKNNRVYLVSTSQFVTWDTDIYYKKLNEYLKIIHFINVKDNSKSFPFFNYKSYTRYLEYILILLRVLTKKESIKNNLYEINGESFLTLIDSNWLNDEVSLRLNR